MLDVCAPIKASRAKGREVSCPTTGFAQLFGDGAVPDVSSRVGQTIARGRLLDNALFDKHGGRTRYQQVGVQPFDAAIRFLEQVESSGAFTILAQSYEDEFWAHFGEATGAGSSRRGRRRRTPTPGQRAWEPDSCQTDIARRSSAVE